MVDTCHTTGWEIACKAELSDNNLNSGKVGKDALKLRRTSEIIGYLVDWRYATCLSVFCEVSGTALFEHRCYEPPLCDWSKTSKRYTCGCKIAIIGELWSKGSCGAMYCSTGVAIHLPKASFLMLSAAFDFMLGSHMRLLLQILSFQQRYIFRARKLI